MSALDIRPLTPTIGAEVLGVDLSRPLADETIGVLRRALLDHLVIFFRDQQLDPGSQLAFARRFGSINVAPFGPKHPDYPELTVLDQDAPRGQGADSWHSDNTFMLEPPMGSILRVVELPGSGGDTCFASMYAAYEALSEPLKALIGGLNAVHDLTKTLAQAIASGLSGADLAQMQEDWPAREHPVVRTHPETGRKALFVNGNFTTRLAGLEPRESGALLPFLIDHVRDPAFQCRFRWAPGSVAFWDNRSVQHFGVPDYSQRRLMHRVTLDGDRPF